jgi:hypothetical protein
MAITRCPYCHAIIDENDKYCNNCGTQLLFAEDDDVEEEIPGEKIIDADVEEKDYTVDEPEDEKKPTDMVERDEDLEEDLEEELEEEPEELALDKLVEEGTGEDDVTEEVILVDEIKAAEAGGENQSEESKEEEGTAELKSADEEKSEDEEEADEKPGIEEEEAEEEADEEKTEEEEAEDEDEEEEEEEKGNEIKEPEEEEKIEKADTKEETGEFAAISAKEDTPAKTTEEPPAASEEEPIIEYIAEDKGGDEAETGEMPTPQPVTFDTQELEGMGRTVELGKDKVDKFLEDLAEKQSEPERPPKVVRKSTGTLPPWASMMRGEPVFSEESAEPAAGEEQGEGTSPTAGDEEVEIFPRRRDSDSTIGLPERVSQSPLPFERVEAEAEAGAEEEEETAGEGPVEEEAPQAPPSLRERAAARPAREPERQPLGIEEMLEEAGPQPPFSFSVFFKSKAFDLLFVGLFWLVALWLAAHSLDMTLFEILAAMSGSMFLLYVVFAFMYFFLFRFFLGETLGDRLFRERE